MAVDLLSENGLSGAIRPRLRSVCCEFCGHPHRDREELFDLESDPLQPIRSRKSAFHWLRRLFPNLTVLENLRMGSYMKRPRRNLEESLNTVFDLFPILEREKRPDSEDTAAGGVSNASYRPSIRH